VHVEVAYDGGVSMIEVPDDATVVTPVEPKPVADPERTIREAVRPWLRGQKPPGTLVLSDLPFAQSIVLPPLLSELARAGFRAGALSLVCGPQTTLDNEITDRYDVHVHDTGDADAHASVGDVAGTPVLFDSVYVDAATRLTLGVVQPHHLCGFTGGAETVCPGISGRPTLQGVRTLGDDPSATWLQTRGNVVHEFIRAAVKLAPPRISLDITVDATGAPTGVWCGPLPHEHQAACGAVAKNAIALVSSYADVVVTAGAPLEAALAVAQQITRPGGTIVAVTDDTEAPDTWAARITSRMSEPPRVLLHRAADVSAVVQSLLPASVVVLPRAPQTVPSYSAP
jgi:hypothetical protein